MGPSPPTYEALETQEELAVDAPVDCYLGGSFDTSLLHIYGDHVVSHVWEREVYCLPLHYMYFKLIYL